MSDTAKDFWNQKYKTREMVSPLDFTHKTYSYLQGKSGVTLLDIGCGDGRDSLFFADQGIHVTAIDFSEKAIERVLLKNPNIEARVINILDMDFPDESFDAVYAHLSVHYFDDKTTDVVFTNIHRMLKEEGLFFVKCKSVDDPLYGQGEEVEKDVYVRKYQRHFFSKDYMAEKLQNFQILELEATESTYDDRTSCFIEAVAAKV